MNDNTCLVHWLGTVPYEQAWKLQERIAESVGKGECPPALLLLEHPHSYTIGRRGRQENLLWSEDELRRNEVSVHWVDRGGDITYHGPGQLVGYPILPLAQAGWQGERLPQADYVGYVRKLEQVIILTLLKFGLGAGQISGKTGVWLQPDVLSRCPRCDPGLRRAPEKIASIGVKVDVRGVSRHGFALNVDPDMSYWNGIVPCGLVGVQMISLAELLETVPTMEEVKEQVIVAFGQVFGYKMVKNDQEIV